MTRHHYVPEPVGEGIGVSVGVGVSVATGVVIAVGIGFGVTVDEPLKTMLGLWFLASVTGKLLVVS